MTIGSLFAGIGGLELGLERAGLGPVVWQVEADPFCRSVLERHWPDARRFDDVRTVGAHNLEAVELVCGGFPCQDLSLAGSGRGLAGARSGLWSEYARIVGELRPRIVVVENVTALLARGFDVVLGDLASLGYDAWWDCLPAAAVGAPHRRDRIFVVAWRVSDAERESVRHEPERGEGAAQTSVGRDAPAVDAGAGVADGDGARSEGCQERGQRSGQGVAVSRQGGGAVADANERGLQAQRLARLERQAGKQGSRGSHADGCDMPQWPPAPDDMHAWGRVPAEAQPAICRVAHGAPAGLDRARLRSIGNAVVPQVAEVIGRAIKEASDE